MAEQRILEVKRHLDGRVQEFDCEAVLVRENEVAFQWTFDRALGGFAKGTKSLGFYWGNRNYNLYRLTRPDGELIGHRFDVIDDVRIEPDRVEYLDLLLDVFIDPMNEVEVQDEDEVVEATKSGLLNKNQLDIIERTLKTILNDPRRIIREALAILPESEN